MFGERFKIYWVSLLTLCSVAGEVLKEQSDKYCATVTHITDSICEDVSETVSVCTLPRLGYFSREEYIPCSEVLVLADIDRYRVIRDGVHANCNNTELLPPEYFDFLDQTNIVLQSREEIDACTPTGLLGIVHLILDIPSFVAKGTSVSNAGIWGHRAYPKVSPLSFPDITSFVESVASLPPGKIPSVVSHRGILDAIHRYKPLPDLGDDVLSIIDSFLDMSLERLIIKMFATTMKRSIRVSTRSIRPTDDEVIEHMQLLQIFVRFMDQLARLNGPDLFNSMVPRDLLLFMIYDYSVGISIMKPGSITATMRKFNVKNFERIPITLANTPPGFFTSLVEQHAIPYMVILGGTFDLVTVFEFEALVLKLLQFSWSANPTESAPEVVEQDPRPNADDVFVHALLVMVYQMGMDAGLVDRVIPFDRILNGTVSTNIYHQTLQAVRIQKHNYLDMAAALVCRLDIGPDAALTFFKLLKQQNLEQLEATTSPILHDLFSHRFIPIESGFLDEDPLGVLLPTPDEWGVNKLFVKFRATLGSRMYQNVYQESSDDQDSSVVV
jgi:hypothetical protein